MTIQFSVDRSHNASDANAVRRLIDDLDEHCEGPWTAVLIKSNGRGIMRGTHGAPPVPGDVAERLIDLATMLNKELHLEGHWIVAWAGDEIVLLWRDGDGDLHFTINFAEPWARVRHWPVTDFVQRAAGAWEKWHDFMVHGMALAPEQQRRGMAH